MCDRGARPVAFAVRLTVVLLAWATCGWGGVHAQLVPVKTVPVATGSQFERFPSQSRGMGGLSLAVDDSLGDAFVNPAKAARLGRTWVFSRPTYYSIEDPDGSAKTLSVGALMERDPWFGGLAVAVQQLDPGASSAQPLVRNAFTDVWPGPSPSSLRPLRETSAENQYVTALGGLQLSDHLALGGMVQWAGLDAMDGVDQLYPGSQGLQQDGYRLDLRAGLLGEWAGHSLSASLLYDRVDMTHEVRYGPVFWPREREADIVQGLTERYFDRTNTWGLHLEYVRPLGTTGWRLGTVLTGNRKGHPKIPNYELMNIPRDPGTSWTYNVGGGLSRTVGSATFGIDVLFEPIFSDTWAEAQTRITQPDGGVIRPGEKTVENDFSFANSILRTGLRREGEWSELLLGVEVHSIRYWLTQQDRIQQTTRDQYESWSEWELTWGFGVDWADMHVRYTGQLTLGTGRPGVSRTAAIANRAAGSFIPAPRDALAVQERRIFTHQLSILIPLRIDGD